MKWLTNKFKPRDFNFVPAAFGSSKAEALKAHILYMGGKFIGLPQATNEYSSDELLAIGYVGIYEGDENFPEESPILE